MWHPLNFVGGAVLLCVVCPLLTVLCVLCGAKIMRAQLTAHLFDIFMKVVKGRE